MADEWLTGYAPQLYREGYTHLIRAPSDPDAISVRAFDLTADVAFGTKINALLWDLVDEETLEHTERSPIRFRRRR